jgi:hypothetical protein
VGDVLEVLFLDVREFGFPTFLIKEKRGGKNCKWSIKRPLPKQNSIVHAYPSNVGSKYERALTLCALLDLR